jgi:hypothetical protein
MASFMVGAALLVFPSGWCDAAWNVGDPDRPGQRTLYNRTAGGAGLGLPVAMGDVNGDGDADVVLTPMNANSGPTRNRDRAGEAVIILSPAAIGGELDLASLDPDALPDDVTLVYGADALDYLGTEVFAGDIDGDGFADVLIGAQQADGPNNQRNGAGEVAIIWGSNDIGGRVIDLDALATDDPVTLVYGAEAGDRLGVWMGTGDFDGDGIMDAVLGADQADGPENLRSHAGETYVIYGGGHLRSLTSIDLAAPCVAMTTIYGIDPEDHSGCTVRTGDLDSDGAAELLIGAGLNRLSASADGVGARDAHAIAGGDGPGNTRTNAGESYVVYGSVGSRPAMIDLAAPPSSTVMVYGVDGGDAYGEELAAGDFNGDGWGDVLIGALTADGPPDMPRTSAGEVALILGGPDLPGSVIDLASGPAGVTFFHGAASSDIAGDTALLADLDKDARDDLVVSSPIADPGGRTNAGSVTVFFGTDADLPQRVDLADSLPELARFVFEGGSNGDILAYSASAGDADNDGFTDLLFNGMGADGLGDLLPTAGDAYLIDGEQVSAEAGRLMHDGPTRTATQTATVTRTRRATRTRTPTASRTPTRTATATRTASRTRRPTTTRTPTVTRRPTRTATPSATRRATGTATATRTVTRTRAPSATRTGTNSRRPTRTATPTRSASPTRTDTRTGMPTNTRRPTMTPTVPLP